MSLNFNADGDKILTGSFDGTAIVLFLSFRFGTRSQESLFIFFKDIQDRSQLLNLSLEAICVELHQLIKPAVYGM